MKLVILFGPHAVGKMTVGQALSRITGLKLFHNHMTIELLAPLFPTIFRSGSGFPSSSGKRFLELLRKKGKWA